MERAMDKKLTPDELFKLLEKENDWDDVVIEILPNGEIRPKGTTDLDTIKPKKPITMREDLGGEYGWHKNRIRAIR